MISREELTKIERRIGLWIDKVRSHLVTTAGMIGGGAEIELYHYVPGSLLDEDPVSVFGDHFWVLSTEQMICEIVKEVTEFIEGFEPGRIRFVLRVKDMTSRISFVVTVPQAPEAQTQSVMRRVVLESPFAGDVERNVRYAKACIRDCLSRGEAPIASHLLFTQPGDPRRRRSG